MPDEFSRLTRRLEHLEAQLDAERQERRAQLEAERAERKILEAEYRRMDKKQERQDVLIEKITESLGKIEEDTTFIRKRVFVAMLGAAGTGVVGMFFWAIQKGLGG